MSRGRFLRRFLVGVGCPIVFVYKFLWSFRKEVITALGIVILMGILGWGWKRGKRIVEELPKMEEVYNLPKLSTKIFDSQGKLLYKFYEDENRTWVPLSKIPMKMIQATLAIEDKEFYRHGGLSIKGIIKAGWHNLVKGANSSVRGGSTITQQLAKNMFFSNEKTIERKFKEAVMAIIIEKKLTKDEILEKYFNQIGYGGDVYGVEEAAWKYFGKHVWEISSGESAFLAGLAAAPSSYSPMGGGMDLARNRQQRVLEEMKKAGFIGEEEWKRLIEEQVEIKNSQVKIEAPHFVFFVRKKLEEEYGFLNFGAAGLKITTTLDNKLQQLAEGVVKQEVDKVANLRISNGAALIVNVKNGDILAMVGSKDYDAVDIDGEYNVTEALRQPGSAIKPINYYLALKNGKTLISTIEDAPVTYQVRGQKPYSPKNYNGKYLGRVTIKTALASSLNIPSVKLLNENGVDNMLALGKLMGINSWGDRGRFGLALALGSGEVKMTELVAAYSIFANMGEKVEISGVSKIEDYQGKLIYKKEAGKEKVLDPNEVYLINTALSSDEARAPIFGLNSKLKIPGKTVAVKTGTTNNLRDNWCIGWTPTFIVAAWVGNNDNRPMSWVASGVSGATPIWNRIMTAVLEERPDEKWETPSGVKMSEKCGYKEYFIAGSEEKTKCENGFKSVKSVNSQEQPSR